MRIFYCTWAILAALAIPGAAQPPTDAGYVIFLRGVPIGHEDISIRSTSAGTTISSRGSAGAPLSTVFRNVEMHYDADGSARSFVFEGSVNGIDVSLRTTLANGTAATQGAEAGKPLTVSQVVSPRTILLPSGLFAGFAALSPRLIAAAVGDEFPAYVVPRTELRARVVHIASDHMQKSTSLFDVRRVDLSFDDGSGEVLVQVTAMPNGDLLRVNIPSQALDVVREDVATATARTDVYSNPGDHPIVIPAAGFNVGATVTLPGAAAAPPAAGGDRHPAVIFVASPDVADRDLIAPGVPAFGQLAGALADAGFISLRYDRRGTGQSGGRTESAALSDYAEDVRTMTKWLADRKDVDPKRIALVGHDTGAWIALLAASKDKRVAAAVSLAAPAVKGTDFVLEQQQLQLDRMRTPAAERDAKIALQQRIDAAALTGKGWEGIAPELRRRADTPWFQSLLAFDPTRVAHDVDRPLLIVHGDLDREVPVGHAERLATAARTGSHEQVAVQVVRGVNHLMQRATSGEVGEYATLTGKGISPDVVATVTAWLQHTLPSAQSR
jgi:alpha-beta hydrolase superfamily lysophospholipase